MTRTIEKSSHDDAIRAVVEERTGNIHVAITAFLRSLALFYVVLSVRDWGVALGAFDPALRFDRAGASWAMYHTIVCVLHPVVAIGLWTTLAWGRVLWFLSVTIQLATMTIWRETFGVDWVLLIALLVGLVGYGVLLAGERFTAKEA
jgi:uncharacterized membrane protein (DUF2068 family)